MEMEMTLALVFQNPRVIPSQEVFGPLKAEPQEVFGVPNTYPQGIWKSRVDKRKLLSEAAIFSSMIMEVRVKYVSCSFYF